MSLPISTQPLDRKAAAHLLRRASFGPTRSEIDQYTDKSPAQAFDMLTREAPTMRLPLDPATSKPWRAKRLPSNQRQDTRPTYFIQNWLDHLCRSEVSLSEKMVYFYHTFFTTQRGKVSNGLFLYHQNQLFRHYALGNLKTLAVKMCYDNAMLQFLDGTRNSANSPNENFAREFLELYSIGKHGPGGKLMAHYTEEDIRQAARVFSGFGIDRTLSEIDPDTGIPMGQLKSNHKGEYKFHDFGSKTFSGKFDRRTITPQGTTRKAVMQEITEFVDMVFSQTATAQHICRRLYRFFVYHQIDSDIEQRIINPLADQLIKSDYEIKPVLASLLGSRHFFDQDKRSNQQKVIGTLVKSPLEMVIGTLRYFRVKLPRRQAAQEAAALYSLVQYRMKTQDMDLYEPAVVAGYPAYHQAPGFQRIWVSSTAIVHRYKFMRELIHWGIQRKNYSRQIKVDSLAFVKGKQLVPDPKDAERLVRELVSDLFPHAANEELIGFFTKVVLLDGLSIINWEMEWKEYQRNGSKAVAEGLRSQLDKLLVSITQSPEYQLS